MSAPVYALLAVDASVTNPGGAGTWVTLLTISFTVTSASSKLLALFSASGTRELIAGGLGTFFRIRYDGVVQQEGAGASVSFDAGRFAGGASSFWNAVAAGVHTIDLQWNCDPGTSDIQPVSLPNEEHAALYVEEIPTTGDGVILGSQHIPVVADLAANITANNDGATYKTVLSSSITTVETTSQILIVGILSWDKSANAGTIRFRVKVDGVVYLGASSTKTAGFTGIICFVACPTVAAGAHTILTEFVSTNAGATCNAVANPLLEGCHMVLQEKAL